MTPLAAYLLLFVAVGIGFIFVHLMAGKFIRPHKPDAAKGTTYECGEPTIGSAWIQFDLRFYVVALLFVIFDVEVAFFFPWAVVFGKANAIAAHKPPTTVADYQQIAAESWDLTPPAARADHESAYHHLHSVTPELLENLHALRAEKQAAGGKLPRDQAQKLANLEDEAGTQYVGPTLERARLFAWLALGEIAVFFGVLLVGFAYLWRRGDLAWVRSLAAERTVGEPMPIVRPPAAPSSPQTVAHS